MGHVEYHRCAVFAQNGSFGFYLKATIGEAMDHAYNSTLSGQFALVETIVKAYPPCPPERRAAAANAKTAMPRPPAYAEPVPGGDDSEVYEDDIPW